MSFLMIWEPGSSGIEFFGKFQCYFPGGRRFWTPERSGEVNLRFLSIFVTFENLYSHSNNLQSNLYSHTLATREGTREAMWEATREATGGNAGGNGQSWGCTAFWRPPKTKVVGRQRGRQRGPVPMHRFWPPHRTQSSNNAARTPKATLVWGINNIYIYISK